MDKVGNLIIIKHTVHCYIYMVNLKDIKVQSIAHSMHMNLGIDHCKLQQYYLNIGFETIDNFHQRHMQC